MSDRRSFPTDGYKKRVGLLRGFFSIMAAGAVLCVSGLCAGGVANAQDVAASGVMSPAGGAMTLYLDRNVLDSLGWQIASTGLIGSSTASDGTATDGGLAFEILPSPEFLAQTIGTGVGPLVVGSIRTRGALRLGVRGSLIPIGNLMVLADNARSWSLVSSSELKQKATPIFDISSAVVRADKDPSVVRMSGSLSIGRSWARRSGLPRASGVVVGRVDVLIRLRGVEEIEASLEDIVDRGGVDTSLTTSQLLPKPDVIIGDLHEVNSYGGVGGISAFSVGTTSCNIGNEQLNWFAETNEHPTIGQNMFRLKDGRFEQIGQSWLKHGFFALSNTLCSGPDGCDGDPSGEHLGVGCSDPYSANLNGQMINLGPRSQVDASTGVFPFPFTAPNPPATIGRRLQVHNDDLDPTLNSGAQYFVEGQYVTPDDAAARNNANNNSYRPISVFDDGGVFSIFLFGETQREQPAIRAWEAADPEVFEIGVSVVGDGLFIIAARVTALAPRFWHYEYAVQNITSHQSARAFEVPISPFATIQNIGFHDVDYHSGEPYSGTDWPATTTGGKVAWSTELFSANSDANALRWGTLYNFRFDSNAPPQGTTLTLKLFRPGGVGGVDEVTFASIGPLPLPLDCNGGIDDLCDVSCGDPGGVCDVPGCGGGADCTDNGILDECEPDCNSNDTADSCDILNGIATDCDSNGVLDACEFADCNGNTIADVCDIVNGAETDCAGGPIGSRSAGQSLYNLNCSSCHGLNGIGSVALQIQEKTRAEIRLELTPPTYHPFDSLPALSEQDFADLETFLTSGGSRGRPDHIPDSCQVLADCGGTSEPDACELENGTQVDADYNGVPDECQRPGAPIADLVAKNRYIAFQPAATTGGAGPSSLAFRVVSADPPFMKWVGPPDGNQLSRLQCDAHYQDWDTQVIYVADADIVPGATYSVQSIFESSDPNNELSYSQPPVIITTHNMWGDVAGIVDPITLMWTPPNSILNVNDVLAVIHNFLQRPNAPHISWVDLAGEIPNGFINVTDVQHVLIAFRRHSYPFGAPVPCP